MIVAAPTKFRSHPVSLPKGRRLIDELKLSFHHSCNNVSICGFICIYAHSRGASKRITGAGIFHIIRRLGDQAGLKIRPHGLRHTAITAALDAFSGDYRKTRAFSRHASLDTVRRYDDKRADHAGQVAQALDAILG